MWRKGSGLGVTSRARLGVTRDWHSVAIIVAAVILQIVTLVVSFQEPTPVLASITLQSVTFGTGLVGSYIFGKSSARDAAKEIIRPHARASFRRAVNLYKALHRQRETLTVVHGALAEEARPDANGVQVVEMSAARWAIIGVQNLVIEQIGTATDALEDWKDIVPEDVEDFARQIERAEAEEGVDP